MTRQYVAILGDVVGSKKIEDREDFQNRLQKACDRVNQAFAKDIYAKIKITKGVDEISGILTKIANVYQMINMISEDIYPNLMRFTVVYGPLDTALESKDAAKIDGVAFHKAAELILHLKKTTEFVIVDIGDLLIDRLLISQMNLVAFLKRMWTKRQFEVVNLYEKLGNQEEVAKRLKITQQTVSRIISTANYDEISKAEQSINDALKEYQEKLLREKTKN